MLIKIVIMRIKGQNIKFIKAEAILPKIWINSPLLDFILLAF